MKPCTKTPTRWSACWDKIQQLFLATIAAQIEAAGGQEFIATTDFPDYWFPEGCKGHVSDDISANISPAMYDRFSRPFHDMVFRRYGGGGLHNCGPNPCLAGYLSHQPAPRSLDLNYVYSKNDLPAIKRALPQESVRLPRRLAGRTGRRRSTRSARSWS